MVFVRDVGTFRDGRGLLGVGLLGRREARIVSVVSCTAIEGIKRRLRRSQLLDAKTSKPLAHVNALVKRLALNNTSRETTSKGVTRNILMQIPRSWFKKNHLPSTVGVSDAVLGDLLDGPLLDLNFTVGLGGSRDGGQGALGDNGDPWAVGVLLRQLSQLLGDLNNVFGSPAVALGVGNGFGFVAESVVSVGQDFVKLVLEELRDEGSRKRKHKDLSQLVNAIQQITIKYYIPCSWRQPPQQEPR